MKQAKEEKHTKKEESKERKKLNKDHLTIYYHEKRDEIVQLNQRSLPLPQKPKPSKPHKLLKLLFLFHLQENQDPETFGEVTGNSGSNWGSESLGVDIGDGCK